MVWTWATQIVDQIDALGAGGLTLMGMLLSTTPGQIILIGLGFTFLAVVLGGLYLLISWGKSKRG